MRWLIPLVLILSLQSTGKDLCSVREFYSIAWGIHDPTERHKQMVEWLTKRQQLCRSTDFKVIWNNLAEWAGNADSHHLRALVVLLKKSKPNSKNSKDYLKKKSSMVKSPLKKNWKSFNYFRQNTKKVPKNVN